jgi:hypothetical protein
MSRPDMDLPRSFTIRESSHRIHNPFTGAKLATLGQALSPPPGTRMLDLACGPARCCAPGHVTTR